MFIVHNYWITRTTGGQDLKLEIRKRNHCTTCEHIIKTKEVMNACSYQSFSRQQCKRTLRQVVSLNLIPSLRSIIQKQKLKGRSQ